MIIDRTVLDRPSRFWKMARTFTGLKLQGELGRFGRTEISDIEGYRELPDGKVIGDAFPSLTVTIVLFRSSQDRNGEICYCGTED